MSGCPSCIGTACPDPVSEVTVNAYTVSGAAALTVLIEPGATASLKVVTVTAATAGFWLLDFTIFETTTATDAGQTLVPPASPGVNQFRKITNAAGVCTFTIDKDGVFTRSWYLGVINLGSFPALLSTNGTV